MRAGSTYRSERRNDWRATRTNGLMPWAAFNQPAPRYFIGSIQNERVTMRRLPRSKYIPHNGKQEMARRVAQLDALIDSYTTSIMANVSIIANDAAA